MACVTTADPAGPTLIVGLANPGPAYEGTRHNIGWEILQELASRTARAGEFQHAQKDQLRDRPDTAGRPPRGPRPPPQLHEPLRRPHGGGGQVLLGRADEVIVIHDEIDVDFGRVRLKRGGGEGGHNGLRSLSQSLGTRDYLRVRAGGTSAWPDGGGRLRAQALLRSSSRTCRSLFRTPPTPWNCSCATGWRRRRTRSTPRDRKESGAPPARYGHETAPAVPRTAHLGVGAELFERASRSLLNWDMHRGAGLVVVDGPATPAGP